MYEPGGASRIDSQIEADKLHAERRQADLLSARTTGLSRWAWTLVGLLAVMAVVWLLGGNLPSLIAGTVAGALALVLAMRLLR
ncbi:MAG: hypothetical protein ACREOM_06190 [Candidatus Dormibacteraceae bacterium]